MQNVTVRLPVRLLAELEREARNQNVSRSEYIRDTLATRHEHETDTDRVRELESRIDELRDDLDHERARADELQGMLQAATRRNRETEALVAYVEERKGVVGRAKRWLFGED